MTIDEAIEERLKVIKVQEKLYKESYSDESKEIIKNATDNDRQLAEWLRELKDLREENKVLTSECDRLIKEKEELNKLKEKAVLDICRREARLREAKLLLKSAIDEWNFVCEWGNCGEYCGWFKNGKCTQEWSGKAEALKLLND